MTDKIQASGIERTSEGLRNLLFDEIDRLRSGKSSVGEARAIAALTSQVMQTVHMEIAVAQLRRDYPADMKLVIPPPLALNGNGKEKHK
jgi:hypothetical protein